VRVCFPVHSCMLTWWKDKGSPLGSLLRTLIPLLGAPLSRTSHLPMVPPHPAIALGVRIWKYESESHINIYRMVSARPRSHFKERWVLFQAHTVAGRIQFFVAGKPKPSVCHWRSAREHALLSVLSQAPGTWCLLGDGSSTLSHLPGHYAVGEGPGLEAGAWLRPITDGQRS
jgi:hypothetical protein